MTRNQIIGRGALHAVGVLVYTGIVVTIMSNAQAIFGPEENMLVPVAMLMLLVLSAAIVGSLIFGQPILWYLDGKKREAVQLFLATLGSLVTLTVLVFIIMAIL